MGTGVDDGEGQAEYAAVTVHKLEVASCFVGHNLN